MIKKITWPSIFFGPINLWNAPRQDELESINLMKGEAFNLNAMARTYELIAEHADYKLERIEQQIKEREFLYYLRSGGFPE